MNTQGYEDAEVHAHIVPVENKVFWDVWFHINLGAPTVISEVKVRILASKKELNHVEQQNWVRVMGIDLSQEAQQEFRRKGLDLSFIEELSLARQLSNTNYVELGILREQNRLGGVARENGYVYAEIILKLI